MKVSLLKIIQSVDTRYDREKVTASALFHKILADLP
jgi:hypothetical protein